MISLDTPKTTKSDTKSSSTSKLSTDKNSDKPSLSFSELLKGIENKSDSKNQIQNGTKTISDAKNTKETSSNSFLSLLKNDTKNLNNKDLIELEIKKVSDNKETVDNKEITEIKTASTLLNETKETLPKDLTITEVKSLIYNAKQSLKTQITQSEGYKKSEIKDLPKTLKGLVSVADKLEVDVSKITIEKVQAKQVAPNDVNTKKDLDLGSKKESKSKMSKDISSDKFSNKVQISTEQFIQAKGQKEIKVDNKSSKSNADETLRSLLSGDKKIKTETNISDDISTVTASIIASQDKEEEKDTLESLLKSDSDSTPSKTDNTSNVHKADSLEVKINESKQMIKYLSQDIKQAIDDYKSPFTRVKVQLNPEKLGEVDLTVIQRGKDLIVNLSSNNTAINALSMNVNELKTQLNNNGINNATFNFSDTSQGQEQSSSQQNNQNQQRQASKEYDYFNNEEQNEEILSSLEIVVPNYA
ncbi:MAG: flagellar hook-length control protein FliK [Campylobacterales bacterium]